MASMVVYLDQWVPVSADYEIFVRADPLTDPGYRVRVEAASVGGLQVRCLAPLPAGFWLRPVRGGALYVPSADPYDTNQFRRDELDLGPRPCWNCGDGPHEAGAGGCTRYTPRNH